MTGVWEIREKKKQGRYVFVFFPCSTGEPELADFSWDFCYSCYYAYFKISDCSAFWLGNTIGGKVIKLLVLWHLEFWLSFWNCLILLAFLTPQIADLCILSRFFSYLQWKIHGGVCLLYLTLTWTNINNLALQFFSPLIMIVMF